MGWVKSLGSWMTETRAGSLVNLNPGPDPSQRTEIENYIEHEVTLIRHVSLFSRPVCDRFKKNSMREVEKDRLTESETSQDQECCIESRVITSFIHINVNLINKGCRSVIDGLYCALGMYVGLALIEAIFTP